MPPKVTGMPQRLNPLEEWVLKACFDAPYSSVSDLAGWGVHSPSQVRTGIAGLEGKGYLGVAKMGNTRPAQSRYWATELGHRYFRHHAPGDDMPWASYDDGLALLRDRFPALEQIYRRLSEFLAARPRNMVCRGVGVRWFEPEIGGVPDDQDLPAI